MKHKNYFSETSYYGRVCKTAKLWYTGGYVSCVGGAQGIFEMKMMAVKDLEMET